MAKIVKIADGAFFVPSYSDQTILRAYSTETTIQSFGFGERGEDPKESDLQENLQEKGQKPVVG
jgi:hypothetical protein